MCFCSSQTLGLARRPAEQRVEPLVRHGQAGAIVEIVEVEPERAVGLQVDQIVVDQLGVFRLAVGREAHHLVLAGIDLEAGVIGEGRSRAGRDCGEMDFLVDLELVAVADARPTWSPIRRRRPCVSTAASLERRGIERRGRVAEMMLGEQQAACRQSKFGSTALSSSASSDFRNSFSRSQSGSAMRNEVKPRGLKAR